MCQVTGEHGSLLNNPVSLFYAGVQRTMYHAGVQRTMSHALLLREMRYLSEFR